MVKALDRLSEAGEAFKEIFEEACAKYDDTVYYHQVVVVEILKCGEFSPDGSHTDEPVLQSTFHTTRDKDALAAAIEWIKCIDFIEGSFTCMVSTEIVDDGDVKGYDLCEVDLSLNRDDIGRRVGYPPIDED